MYLQTPPPAPVTVTTVEDLTALMEAVGFPCAVEPYRPSRRPAPGRPGLWARLAGSGAWAR